MTMYIYLPIPCIYWGFINIFIGVRVWLGRTWIMWIKIVSSILSLSDYCVGHIKHKEKLRDSFWEYCPKASKYQKLTFFDLSNLEQFPLERFNQIHLLAVHQYPPWKASCQNREKVIQLFLRKLPPSKNKPNLTFPTFINALQDDSIKSIIYSTLVSSKGSFTCRVHSLRNPTYPNPWYHIKAYWGLATRETQHVAV